MKNIAGSFMSLIKDIAVYSSPSYIKTIIAANTNSDLRSHSILALSRDLTVLSVLSLHTPHEPIQHLIFKRTVNEFGNSSDAYPMLLMLSNNPNLFESVRSKLSYVAEKLDERDLNILVSEEFKFMRNILKLKKSSNSVVHNCLFFTTIVSSLTNISPSLQQKILNLTLETVKKNPNDIYPNISNLGKKHVSDIEKYSYLAYNLITVTNALDFNQELNHYSRELVSELKNTLSLTLQRNYYAKKARSVETAKR